MKTYAEIGRELGISRQRAQMIAEVAIWKLFRGLRMSPPPLSTCPDCKERPRMPGSGRCLICHDEKKARERAARRARRAAAREAAG